MDRHGQWEVEFQGRLLLVSGVTESRRRNGEDQGSGHYKSLWLQEPGFRRQECILRRRRPLKALLGSITVCVHSGLAKGKCLIREYLSILWALSTWVSLDALGLHQYQFSGLVSTAKGSELVKWPCPLKIRINNGRIWLRELLDRLVRNHNFSIDPMHMEVLRRRLHLFWKPF